MKKIGLISANNLDLKDGGSIYLKSLLTSRNLSVTSCICQSPIDTVFIKGVEIEGLNRTRSRDIFSRVLFTPSWLYTHLFIILSWSKRFDVLLVHNSRLIGLGLIIRMLYRCDVRLIRDNNEVELSISLWKANIFNIARFLDIFLLVLYENILARFLSGYYAITKNESNLENCLLLGLEPLLYVASEDSLAWDDYNALGFLGNMDFYPNELCIGDILDLAYHAKEYRFIVAGRATGKKKWREQSNVEFRYNLTNRERREFYNSVGIVLILMRSGSGQKIKVAEAIYFKRIIIATKHSMEGYNGLELPTVYLLEDDYSITDLVQAIDDILSTPKKKLLANIDKSWNYANSRYFVSYEKSSDSYL